MIVEQTLVGCRHLAPVRLYSVIVNFICNQIVAHFYNAKTGHLRCLLSLHIVAGNEQYFLLVDPMDKNHKDPDTIDLDTASCTIPA